MTMIYNCCKRYAQRFTPSSESILMIGGTGLGKTHLSAAIAKVVIEKGLLRHLRQCAEHF
jgi:DNA replication protein DnaC